MNFKIVEKSLLPLLLATIFIVAFHWQFTKIYNFLIEHFTEEKLSILYTHLLIYSFLVFSIFLFFMNLFNNLLIKSKVFIVTIVISMFGFYAFSYETFLANINYFIQYPLSTNETMLMVLFVISILFYGLYSIGILLFNKFIPFSHSLVFLLISLSYALWFIQQHAYPILTILTKFKALLV
ncbi:MAG: Unknown protein [uncultured Sulfurovum sp.]|uniref:Uncharacterized protein n=1 Tax=uncultured Sulfurovum sp. TaxID=269237 RepID=A0A6S6S086_9BACT|nr:MAG: Unknown protein [uncultured Sulfurovum sp.]